MGAQRSAPPACNAHMRSSSSSNLELFASTLNLCRIAGKLALCNRRGIQPWLRLATHLLLENA
eukprot:888368-Pelagomonas_calceolata.AAC.3